MKRETCLRIFKDFVRLNIEIVEGVAELLPENIRKSARTLHRDVVAAVREVSDEFLAQSKPAADDDNKVRHVDIE